MNICTVSFCRSLHKYIWINRHSPLPFCSFFGARIHRSLKHSLDSSMPKHSWCHVCLIQCKVHCGCFWQHPMTLSFDCNCRFQTQHNLVIGSNKGIQQLPLPYILPWYSLRGFKTALFNNGETDYESQRWKFHRWQYPKSQSYILLDQLLQSMKEVSISGELHPCHEAL